MSCLALLLLLLTSTPRQPQPTWVDVIELNHVVRDDAVVFSQVIYWRWERDGKLHVVAWRSVPVDYTVQRVRGVWIDEREGQRFYGRGYRFRSSNYDPEMEDRKAWPAEWRCVK